MILPHAVVVGLELNGLGVVRSLAAGGVPVVALDSDKDRPTCSTRHARVIKAPTLSGDALIEALLRLRRDFAESPILILTQEASVATVSARRSELTNAYRFSMPGNALMVRLLDKLAFQDFAEQHGFLIPRAVRLNSTSAGSMLEQLCFPCVLKPAVRAQGYSERFAKAYRVASPEEALSLWQDMCEVMPEIIVQEWIEGGDGDVYFCLQYRPPDKKPVTSFVGRKLRQWPRQVGGTACCLPAPQAAQTLAETTDRFFGTAGFVGVCSMEYKRDRRDGQYYMVEPTVGRTDHQEEIATLNGVNIPLAAYYGELGLTPPAFSAREVCGWRDPVADARARASADHEPGSPLPLRDAYWRLHDPLPFLALQLSGITDRLARLARRSSGFVGHA